MVTENKDDFLRFARFQIHLDVVRAVRRPAVRDGIEGFPPLHRRRVVPTAIGAEERVALRIKAGELLRAGEVREMIAALAILGLVIDDLVHDLDLAGAEIALEIGGVVLRVPQAEFDAGKDRQLRRFFAAVGHGEFPDLKRFAQRNEVTRLRLDFFVAGADDGVAHAVTAFVFVQFGARGLPGGRPEFAGVIVAEVEVTPANIERRVVIAIARQAAQARIAIEGITTGGVGDDPEIRFAAEVIDPGQRGVEVG